MYADTVNDYISSIRPILNELDCTIDTLPINPSERAIDDRIYQVRNSMDDAKSDRQYEQMDTLLEKLYKLK